MKSIDSLINLLENTRYSALLAEARENGVSMDSDWFKSRSSEISAKADKARRNVTPHTGPFANDLF